MSKREHRQQIEEQVMGFLGRGKEMTRLQPSTNLDFEAYLRSEALRRASFRRGSGGRLSARSRWFVRGEGTI